MAWRDGYLDMVLIPLAVLFPALYHLWLYRTVRRRPLTTTVGISVAARRIWVFSMMKNNEKQAILVVQSIRNVLMGSTLVGTTSILFCTGVAAVLSSTYAVKKPLSDAIFGAHGEHMMALKYLLILSVFLAAFLCHSLAICTLNQASFLVNALSPSPHLHLPAGAGVTAGYVADVMERGFLLSLAGNRLFFAGAPLLLWISGPVFPCICSMAMIPMLYNMDVVDDAADDGRKSGCGGGGGGANAAVVMDGESSDDQSIQVV